MTQSMQGDTRQGTQHKSRRPVAVGTDLLHEEGEGPRGRSAAGVPDCCGRRRAVCVLDQVSIVQNHVPIRLRDEVHTAICGRQLDALHTAPRDMRGLQGRHLLHG
jgi:hypothetical protein